MTYTKDQLIEALYKEYVFLCHDDFDPDNDATPEEYLEMLKEMSYDDLLEETNTDEEYNIEEFMEAWSWLRLINWFLFQVLFGFYIGGNVLHHLFWIRLL